MKSIQDRIGQWHRQTFGIDKNFSEMFARARRIRVKLRGLAMPNPLESVAAHIRAITVSDRTAEMLRALRLIVWMVVLAICYPGMRLAHLRIVWAIAMAAYAALLGWSLVDLWRMYRKAGGEA